MVGKVVGKRRKRPLPESKFNEISHWSIMHGQAAMPSPSLTVFSEPPSKRVSTSVEPSFFLQVDEQAALDFANCNESQFLNLDMCQSTVSSTNSDRPYVHETGLPTPSMSPPNTTYQAPTEISRTPSVMISNTHCSPMSNVSPSSYQQIDDEETTCIKLLAHLKRHSKQEGQSIHALVSLVSKTTSVIQRLLKSTTVRSDYSCHLLLTSIMTHLASVCEQLLSHHEANRGQEFLNESAFIEDSATLTDSMMHTAAKTATSDAVSICVGTGSLLKRKPLNGFQVLGRQESALIDCERRLRAVCTAL